MDGRVRNGVLRFGKSGELLVGWKQQKDMGKEDGEGATWMKSRLGLVSSGAILCVQELVVVR